MTSYRPFIPETLKATVNLPASKSISARVLVMGALAGHCVLTNLSDCDDTQVLRQALDLRLPEIDIKAAGTAMRFSTAYFATCAGEVHVITGTERMRQRPIRILVDALRQLGADIEYLGQDGFPPLRIKGKHLKGGAIELPADVSSQYISALLMVAPTLQEGLRLHLVGEVLSRPYIDMTIGLMKEFGADADWISDQDLIVQPKKYTPYLHYTVEPDWSAASYWYELLAFSRDQKALIELPGLREQSWQGDSIVRHLFSYLGVQTKFESGKAVLTKSLKTSDKNCLNLDFSTCPDLAQTLVVTCALLGQPFCFTGLQSLRIKETDRIAALQNELRKLGVGIESVQKKVGQKLTEQLQMLNRPIVACHQKVEIETYEDHRMAMSFAPAALLCPQLTILHPEVVSKSYPGFWKDLEHLPSVDC